MGNNKNDSSKLLIFSLSVVVIGLVVGVITAYVFNGNQTIYGGQKETEWI